MIQDSVVFVSILRPDGVGSDKSVYVAHSGYVGPLGLPTATIRVNIQPASAEKTVLVDGVLGKVYNAFTTCSGITEGMILTVSGTGDAYKVRGRERYEIPMGKHYELTLTKDDER